MFPRPGPRLPILRLLLALVLLAGPASAQESDPFEHGWTLDGAASSLRFASVKNDRVAEDSGFTGLSGSISPEGNVRLAVDLESVETGIDIRNVRLRFIFFETFLFRESVVSARLEAAALTALARTPHHRLDQTVTLSLHGVEQDFDVPLDITLLEFDRVAVRSRTPVPVPMEPFGLDAGRSQLESTAEVEILPLVFVTFELVFQRNKPGTRPPTATATQVVASAEGPMSRPECLARISALSRLGDIGFDDGATLAPRSERTLERLFGIASRCGAYRIEIGGHTGDSGSAEHQRSLSRARAQAVADALTGQGIAPEQLVVVGYGAQRPIVPNTSAENRAQNGRIEFRLLQ